LVAGTDFVRAFDFGACRGGDWGYYTGVQRLTLTLAAIASIAPFACSAAGEHEGLPSVSSTGGSSPMAGAGGVPVPAGGSGGTPASGGAPLSSGGVPVATGGTAPGQRDPSAFAWPEANPDGGSARLCKPGHYVGTYKCTVTGPPGAPAVALELTGPVDLRLEQAQEGEFLVVNGGTLTTSAGLLQLVAGLTGKLDCQTGRFEGALENGELSIPPFPPGGTVGGTLEGAFVPATSAMDGTWDLEAGTAFPGYGCEGPWTITWTGE
jgi:hypothetical protein